MCTCTKGLVIIYVEGEGGRKNRGGGQCYFKLAKRGGSSDSARVIRSQFKKGRLVNQLDRMEYKDI